MCFDFMRRNCDLIGFPTQQNYIFMFFDPHNVEQKILLRTHDDKTFNNVQISRTLAQCKYLPRYLPTFTTITVIQIFRALKGQGHETIIA